MHRCARNARGYSLAELMTIVAIIGIVSMVGLPALMQLMPQYRIRSAATDVASSLRLARDRAVSTRRDWQVLIDTSTTPAQYRLRESVNGSWLNAGFDGRLVPAGAPAGRPLSSVTVDPSSATTITFERDGTTTSTSNQLIVLTVSSNWVRYNHYEIKIEPSGNVTITPTKV